MPDTLDLSKFKTAPSTASGDTLDLSKFQSAAPAEPGLLEKLGGWRGVGATGIRGLSGLLAAEGGVPGAAISGGGEALAEALEGSLGPTSVGRIGTEAALGTVPASKLIKGGRLVESALRSGAMGAAHTAASEIAAGQTPNLSQVGLGAILGGAGGAVGSKFIDAGEAAPRPTKYEVVPTAQTGPGTQVLTKLPGSVKPKPAPVVAPQSIRGSGVPIGVEPRGAGIPTPKVPYRTGITSDDVAAAAKDAAAALKAQKAAQAQSAFESAISGLEEGDPRGSVTLSGELAGGKGRVSIPFRTPGEASADVDATTGERLAGAGRAGNAARSAAVAPEAPITPQETIVSPPKVDQKMQVPAGADVPPVPEIQPEATGKQPKTANQRFEARYQKILDQYPTDAAPQPIPEAWKDFQTTGTDIAPAEESVEQPLARLFKSKTDAVGQAYRSAQADAEANPLAVRQLGIGLQKEATASGLPTRGKGNLGQFLSEKVSPDIGRQFPETEGREVTPTAPGSTVQASAAEPPQGVPPPDYPARTGLSPEQQAEELTTLQRLFSEKGFVKLPQIDPEALKAKAVGTAAGAGIGATAGGTFDEEDPVRGALYGGLAGGTLGYAAGEGGLSELLAYRNAGLLSGMAQLKKPLSDLGTYLNLAAERGIGGMTGKTPGGSEQAVALGKQLFNPQNIRNYVSALRNPEIAQEATGELARSLDIEAKRGALGMVARPFGAAQYATQMAMERAGVPREEALQRLFLGTPESEPAQKWLDVAGTTPGRIIAPFQRIYTNLAEQGLQRVPGLNMVMGNPETRLARGIIGGGAVGAGALTGISDNMSAEEGQPPTGAAVRGLRRAALGPLALPYMVGETMTGPTGLRDLYYSIPGLHAALDAPGPKDTLWNWAQKIGKGQLEQMLPSAVIPWEEK